MLAALFALLPLEASAQRAIDFADISLSPDSYDNGSGGGGGFTSGGAFFNNHYNPDFGSWGGWALSNVSDTETAGWDNQYAAITGAGLGPGGVYGVAYVDSFTPTIPRIVLPEGESVLGIQVTNTTYAYHAMLEGDDFSRKFGGADGSEPDFFRLTIHGLTAGEASTGSVDFYLGDYRFEDDSLDHLVDVWSWVDLSGLGADTRALEFTLASSDTGAFGMNTPAYFALGEVAVIPEPGTFALWAGLGLGLTAGVLRMRGRKASEPTARP